MHTLLPLELLNPGQWGEVHDVCGEPGWVGRMAELGIRHGCRLQMVQPARVAAVRGDAAVVQRLLELGVFEGEELELIAFAPLGDPLEIQFAGGRLSLRRREAAGIEMEMTG